MPTPSVSETVRTANAALRSSLPFDDTPDFEDARRGFIGRLDPCIVTAADGRVVWDNESYRASSTGPPRTRSTPACGASPPLNAIDGLFEVVPGIYQVRGLDLSNITFVEGDTGVLVIDPLISVETAAAALALYRQHRGDRPVVGVIYTHSHVDHFGGVKGVTSQADVDAGRCADHRAGRLPGARGRRERLRRDRRWRAARATCTARRWSAGRRARSAPAWARRRRPAPSRSSRRPTPSRRPARSASSTASAMEFQLTPGTEAPAEMNVLFPDHRALCMAENTTHTLHNLLTLRGALVRDRARLGALHHRGHRPLRRAHGRRLRLPPLADLGPRARRRLPGAAARPVRLPPRPDAAHAQPGHGRQRDRRGDAAAAGARARLARARLLRLGEPQREGHLPALHGLVRRQPGAPLAAPAGRGRRRATWPPWAARTRCWRQAREAFAAGDFRWVVELLEPPRLRGARDGGRPGAPGGRLRAARLRLRERHLAVAPTWPGPRELRHGTFGTPASTDSAGHAGRALAGADLRRHRHPRRRAAGLGRDACRSAWS